MRRWIGIAAAALAAGALADGAAAATQAQVFFTKGEKLAPATRLVVRAPLADALRQLLAGPTAAERARGLRTNIPAGTRLRGVAVRGGIAYVDLTSRFETSGGSLSMRARIAQVVYTATQFRTVKAVRLKLAGRLAETIGGEGVVVDEPLTRADVRGFSR